MKYFYFLSVAFVILTTVSCDHFRDYGSKSGTAYFWQNAEPGTEFSLYIDGDFKGKIPYIAQNLTETHENGLAIDLVPGKYSVTGTYPDNRPACAGELTLSIHSGSTDISASWNNDKCSVKMVYQ